jgi:hypothetical protein
LWIDTRDAERVADLSRSIAVFFVPSLPFFFAFPMLLRAGVSFWATLALCVLVTLALYALAFWALPRLGVRA